MVAQARRMEEIEASGERFEAAGNDRTVHPGRWFQLTGHLDIDPDGTDSRNSEFPILRTNHSDNCVDSTQAPG